MEAELPTRKRKAKQHTPPPYVASVTQTANAGVSSGSTVKPDDDGVILRIKKCLERAKDSGAGEREAKAALHLAAKLMRRLNVTQADVFAHESAEERKKHGGQSQVVLRRRDGDREKGVREACYLDTLAGAIECFFDCKHYTYSRASVFETTFYGIAENTVAAAEAYCMVYNLMVEWARPHKGVTGKNSYCLGVSEGLWTTAEKEKDEEAARAQAKDAEEMKKTIAQEEAERQAQLSRLEELPEQHDESAGTAAATKAAEPAREDSLARDLGSPGVTGAKDDADESDDVGEWEEWDGFSDDDDTEQTGWIQPADFHEDTDDDSGLGDIEEGDLDTHINNLVAAMNPQQERFEEHLFQRASIAFSASPDSGAAVSAHQHSTNYAEQQPVADITAGSSAEADADAGDQRVTWKSHMQLTCFRDAANSIADTYLKDQETKLYAPRKRKAVQQDWDAYDSGARDSKKIDVRRKMLPGAVVEQAEDLTRETV